MIGWNGSLSCGHWKPVLRPDSGDDARNIRQGDALGTELLCDSIKDFPLTGIHLYVKPLKCVMAPPTRSNTAGNR